MTWPLRPEPPLHLDPKFPNGAWVELLKIFSYHFFRNDKTLRNVGTSIYIHTDIQTDRQTDRQTYIHTYIHTYIRTYTLFRHGKNISYRIKILKIKLIYMFAVWEYEEENRRSISFLKLVKDLMPLTLDGRLFHKCAPQMCPTVAETTFQKIGTGLRHSQFVITIPKSIVRAEGFK